MKKLHNRKSETSAAAADRQGTAQKKEGGYRGVLMGVGAPMEDMMMPVVAQGKDDIDFHNGMSLEH